MKRHVAALALIVFLGSLATPSEIADPSGSRTVVVAPATSDRLSRGASLTGAPPSHEPSTTGMRSASVSPAGSRNPLPAIYTASATWCAPTPTQCQSWGPPARLGAVFGFRWGDAPWWARVWKGQAFVDVLVVSHCACGGTHNAIDLSPAAFSELADLSRGRIDVAVEVLTWPGDNEDPPPYPDDNRLRIEDGGPRPTLPPTSVAVQ